MKSHWLMFFGTSCFSFGIILLYALQELAAKRSADFFTALPALIILAFSIRRYYLRLTKDH